MKNKYSRVVAIIIFFLTLISCGGDDNTENNSTVPTEFQQDKELVKSIIDEVAKPEIEALYTSTLSLQQSIGIFTENVNESNLKDVQAKWLIVAEKWAKCYAFNIGDLKSKYYNLRFANFPINTEGVDEKIESLTTVSANDVANMGSDMKGLYGVEYLLFKDGLSETIKKFTNENYKNALQFMVAELLKNAMSFQADWKIYAQVLESSKNKELSIDDPLNLLFNGLNNVIHYTWETKIGKSAGYEKNDYYILEKIEARYSKQTLAIIKQNIAITKQVFFNQGNVSIADKIKFITKSDELNNEIKTQYATIENALLAIENPFYDAVQIENEKVKELYNALKRLEVLFSTDVKSRLSLVITGTDGDGD